jgi:hypothetical protein
MATTSALSTANQASDSSAHVRQPAAMSANSAGVLSPAATACSARADSVTRCAQVPAHQVRSSADAKHQAEAVQVSSVNPAASAHDLSRRPASGSASLRRATR